MGKSRRWPYCDLAGGPFPWDTWGNRGTEDWKILV